jgi:hypothetical protein
MAGPGKCMRLENEGIHKEIWTEEFRANSEGEFSDDSATFVKFLSDSEQSDCSVDEHNVMLAVTQTRVGAEQPLFLPFSGGSGLNADLECHNNPLEYSEFFITPELANLKQRSKPAYPTISTKYAKLGKISSLKMRAFCDIVPCSFISV